MGRPSRYTNKLGEAICKRIADGESLRSICEDAEMPHRDTVRGWLASSAQMYVGFIGQYTRARQEQADTIFDRMADVAADENLDVQRAKLIIDTEKWRLARMRPKKYGTDRVQHVGDEDAPLAVTINRVNKRATKSPDN